MATGVLCCGWNVCTSISCVYAMLGHWTLGVMSGLLVGYSFIRHRWYVRLGVGVLGLSVSYLLNRWVRLWIRDTRPSNELWLTPLIRHGGGHGLPANVYGMPSMHAQQTAFMVGLAYASRLDPWIILATSISAVSTCVLRYVDHKHTAGQLLVGLLLGLLLGLGTAYATDHVLEL